MRPDARAAASLARCRIGRGCDTSGAASVLHSGALNQMEFCVLMFRLNPELMEESQFWLEKALIADFI